MLQQKLHMVATVLVLVGAFNWGFVGGLKWNPVESLVGKRVASYVYILVGLAALSLAFHRDTYLPFLGAAVAPCSVLSDRVPPGATKEVSVAVAPGAKVIYWAAEPASEHLNETNDWKKAYADYENAGVATANTNGTAILKVRSPQEYKVPLKGTLSSHVHYRVCGPAGWVSPVQTVYVD